MSRQSAQLDDIASLRHDLSGQLSADEEAALRDAPEDLVALCSLLVGRSRVLATEGLLATLGEMHRRFTTSERLASLLEQTMLHHQQAAELAELESFHDRIKSLDKYELSRGVAEGLIDYVKSDPTTINLAYCAHLVADLLKKRDGHWPAKSAVAAGLAERLGVETHEAIQHVNNAVDLGFLRSRVSSDGGQFERSSNDGAIADIECYLSHSGEQLRHRVNADLADARRAKREGSNQGE